MRDNNKNILKECLNCLNQNPNGLFWIQLLKEVYNKTNGLSVKRITKTIFEDLKKNNRVDYSAKGFFYLNNKKYCSLKWIISMNPKITFVHCFLNSKSVLGNSNIKIEVDNVSIESLLRYNIINNKVYRLLNEEKITCLLELHNHILRYNNFLKVRGCGIKYNYDILQLYDDYYVNLKNDSQKEDNRLSNNKRELNNKKKYINKIQIKGDEKNVVATIRETFNEKLITTNAFNICKALNIIDTYALKSFIESHKNFLMIKKCTKKENEQLLKLNSLYNS